MMIKNGASNFQNQNIIVDVIDDKKCEKCEENLNLMNTNKGIIVCDSCGCENSVVDNSEEGKI